MVPSLYGSYWVDRPPLLVTLFRLASDLGGAVPLRLMGCLATAIVVLGCAHVARTSRGTGPRHGRRLMAAGLCVSPLMGGLAVNGELLAAPFVVAGLAAMLTAIHERRERRAAVAAALAGAATVAALLVKQNMADVGVFAAVVLLVGWRRGEISGSEAAHSSASYVAGRGAGAGRDGRLDPAARHLPRWRLRRDVPVPDPGRAADGLRGTPPPCHGPAVGPGRLAGW